MSADLRDYLPLLVTVAIVVAVLWAAHLLLIARQRDLGGEKLFPRQLALLAMTLVGVVVVAMMLPVSDQARGQIIGLIGLALSGLVAFSSSTIVANLMSGIMLRMTRPFHTGDYITVGTHFGRVVERGLLDTEIQTENRELVALPNTFLIANPVTVVRSSGAIVNTTVTLGYDVHHRTAEAALLRAAEACGLEDPFVRVLELGDFAVGYRVSGLLKETKGLLTARSQINRHVLDSLHGAGIEIMSPSVMAQRPLPPEQRLVPAPTEGATAPAPGTDTEAQAEAKAEAIVFDKAESAAREAVEEAQDMLHERIGELEQALETSEGEDRQAHAAELAEAREKLAALPGAAPAG